MTKENTAIKRTFKELITIDNIVGRLYRENDTLPNSKFGYAYKRFAEKNLTPATDKIKEAFQDIRIDNALEDEKTKAIITDKENPRGYKYSKEGLKAVIKAEQALEAEHMAKEITIEPYIATTIPEEVKNLPEDEKELLKGVLI